MEAKHLKEYTVRGEDAAYRAAYMLQKMERNKIVAVTEADGRFLGIITETDMRRAPDADSATAADICNRSCRCVRLEEGCDAEEARRYALTEARSLFIDYALATCVPVIDEKGDLVDLISRERAFWRYYYDKKQLPRMCYAYSIWEAAVEAKRTGYPSFSVLEFGVAGGNGLVNCEFHAREISRILKVGIEIYGFDSGQGLPVKNAGYKDRLHTWRAGSFPMDVQKLEERLTMAKLVLGDIHETARDFVGRWKPAPIGCMLVDVDYYSSTLPVLDMLHGEDDWFLPRIHMYFDDIFPEYEAAGEALAIHEFNQREENMNISPERQSYTDHRRNTKICHRFTHERYNRNFKGKIDLPLKPFL